MLASEHYDGAEPVNLGTGSEIRVGDLALLIAEVVGYEGRIVYDPTKPDGQPRRCLDTTRAKERFGFTAEIGLREGLENTVRWYLESGDLVGKSSASDYGSRVIG